MIVELPIFTALVFAESDSMEKHLQDTMLGRFEGSFSFL